MTTQAYPARVTIKTTEQARAYLAEFHPEQLEGKLAEADSYKVTDECPRCCGAGYYPSPQHGACFHCGGRPELYRRTRTVTVVDVAKSQRKSDLASMKRARQADERVARADEFLAQHDGLAAALEVEHHILQDLSFKLHKYGDLSEKQVALALKIARESQERAEKRAAEAELLVAAPVGDARVTVEGEVVSVKWMESQFGGAFKITVKVTTDAGQWLAWGTLPRSVEDAEFEAHEVARKAAFDAVMDWMDADEATRGEEPEQLGQFDVAKALRGRRIKFDARLKAGREEHFALFSRPTKAELVD